MAAPPSVPHEPPIGEPPTHPYSVLKSAAITEAAVWKCCRCGALFDSHTVTQCLWPLGAQTVEVICTECHTSGTLIDLPGGSR